MPDVGEFFDKLAGYALTWLPLVFFGLIIYLLWRTLQYMPRVKPAKLEASAELLGHLGRRRRRRGGEGRAAGGRRLPPPSEALPAPGRPRAEGDPALRPARHRQDAARQGRRERVRRQVLLAERLRLRRDVRRPRRLPDPQALRRGAQERARDRLHRRARRRRHRPRRRRLQPRARPDAEPAARRAGRLRRVGPGDRHGRVEPAPGSRSRRCSVPAASTGRCSSRRPTSPAARRSSACTRAASRSPTTSTSTLIARQTSGLTGADLANICNEAAIFAGRQERTTILAGGLRGRDGARRRRPAAAPRRHREGEADPRLPRGRARARRAPDGRPAPDPEGDDHRARRRARLRVLPAARGALPAHEGGVPRRDEGRARRPRRRADRLRPRHERRRERPREGDRDRPRDGLRVRHVRGVARRGRCAPTTTRSRRRRSGCATRSRRG